MIKEIQNHRSIRRFSDKPIEQGLLDEVLLAATRASTVGTMQLYSIIVTTDDVLRNRLCACHFNQPASKAPTIVTFCADVNRFHKWCQANNADPDYENFVWYSNAAIDTLLASQNFVLQAQALGLGICYLGTTLYNADKIIEILAIPKGVVPITTVAVGYPDEEVGLTYRLPLEAVVHNQKYCDYSNAAISRLYQEIDNSDLTKKLVEVNGVANLAQVFTQKRYTSKDNNEFSEKYLQVLKHQGFIK